MEGEEILYRGREFFIEEQIMKDLVKIEEVSGQLNYFRN